MVDFQAAMAARALRTIKAELEFLADTGHITPSQLSSILSNLPPSDITSTLANTSISAPRTTETPTAQPVVPVSQPTPPVNHTPSFNEKTNPIPTPAYNPAPPAYSGPPPLSVVTAVYPYAATDAGDLPLQVNDTINVTEYVNADWWRGVNPATGRSGIFPKNYVKPAAHADSSKDGYGYGNLPLQVANGGSNQDGGQYVGPPQEPHQPSKFEEGGKKFGKKLGNAAIFGAGATIGGKIVNGIF
ncbi:Intersectin-2 [Dactylella cylindrospora]|nr:Intersectin-2 [Dactylella cylindrospora]